LGEEKMSKNLFTKPIDKISFNDIKAFCDAEIAENVRVDYKENFPNDLAKHIVGFANKYGGILLIGVKADKTKNTPTSIDGVKLEDGLEEKVINISQANTNPPITPEVKVFPFKSKNTLASPDKAAVFVRIEESLDTPHMNLKDKDNRIYERIHNETRPAELRTIEELIEKRQRGKKKLQEILEETIVKKRHDGFRTVYVIPASPVKQIIHFNIDTDKFLRENIPKHLRFGEYKPLRGGALFTHKSESGAEITKEGLILYKESWKTTDSHGAGSGDISIDRTMIDIIGILQYSKIVFEKFGYFGKVLVGIELDGVAKKFLFTTTNRGLEKKYTTNEANVSIEQIFSYDEFSDIVLPSVTLIETLFRSFGLVTKKEVLGKWVKLQYKFSI